MKRPLVFGGKEARDQNLKLQRQLVAIKRTLWAIVHQNGGEITINADAFKRAHEVTAGFEFSTQPDGTAYIKTHIEKDFSENRKE